MFCVELFHSVNVKGIALGKSHFEISAIRSVIESRLMKERVVMSKDVAGKSICSYLRLNLAAVEERTSVNGLFKKTQLPGYGDDPSAFVLFGMDLFDLDNSFGELSDIEIYELRTLNGESNLQVIMPMQLVKPGHTVRYAVTFPAIEVLLSLVEIETGIGREEPGEMIWVMKPKIETVYIMAAHAAVPCRNGIVRIYEMIGGNGEVETPGIELGYLSFASPDVLPSCGSRHILKRKRRHKRPFTFSPATEN